MLLRTDSSCLAACAFWLCWLLIAVDNFKSKQIAARTGVTVGDMLSSLRRGCCAATTPAGPPGAIIQILCSKPNLQLGTCVTAASSRGSLTGMGILDSSLPMQFFMMLQRLRL